MNWTFSISGEYLKLYSPISGETFYFLKRYTIFKPNYITNTISIDTVGANILKTINRAESITPAPGANMTAYINSLATLASV